MSDRQDITGDMLTSLSAMIGSNASPEEFARYVLNLQIQQAQANDPELAELLRACAIPRSFDAEVIGVLRNAPEDAEGNQQLLADLLQFNFVQTHADGGYVYHDTTRDLLLADWQQQPEQLAQYQERLAAFYHQRGQTLFEQEQYEQALAELLRAVEFGLENDTINLVLGKIYVRLKQYQEALSYLDRYITQYPEKGDGYYGRGHTYLNIKNYPAALADFSKAIELQPEDGNYYYWRGHIYLNTQNYPAALADLSKAIELQPDNGNNYYGRSFVYYITKDYDAALADLSKAVELQPKNGNNYYGRSFVYYITKDYDAALADLSKAIELQPRDSKNYRWRGQLYFDTQNYPAALADFSKAIELQPEDGTDYRWRGRVYLDTQDYPAALNDFSKAIELQPDNGNNYRWRTLTYILLLDDQSGLVDLEHAIKLQPNEIHSLFWHGAVLELFQHKEEAQAAWQRTTELLSKEKTRGSQQRVAAKLALMADLVEETYQHYNQAIEQCSLLQLNTESTYLRLLAKRFPEREAIQTVAHWFEEEVRKRQEQL